MIMMGHHNFKDETLIKRWYVVQKMNGTSKKLKDKNKWSNRWELFLFIAKNCVFLEALEFAEHECEECDQKIVESSKGKRNIKKWA